MTEAEEAAAGAEDSEALERPLAPGVRARVVEQAAATLGELPPDQMPAALRQVARFEPKRRARLAGAQIGTQLERDPRFRGQVAQRMAQELPELAAALEQGEVPPAADPEAVAAAAYLLRHPGWTEVVAAAEADLRQRDSEEAARAAEERVHAVQRQLDDTRARFAEERDRMRSELRSSRRTIADVRRAAHAERTRARQAEERAERAEQEAVRRVAELEEQLSSARAENRRLGEHLAQAREQADAARRAARSGRSAEDARLRVLLEVLQDAARGLYRELDLPSTIERPGDLVAGAASARGEHIGHPVPAAGRPDDDPGLLEAVLRLPQVHLVVDGYNVTKSAYPELPLSDQRARLMAGLEGLATRTRAEITCVFDGAEVAQSTALGARRRVRLVFSAPDETADTQIIRMVRAEPAGRPVAVVSSDREIATAVRRAGARPLPASLLVRALGDGDTSE